VGKFVAYKSGTEGDEGYNEAWKAEGVEQNQIETEAEDKPGDKEVSNLNVTCVHLVNYRRG